MDAENGVAEIAARRWCSAGALLCYRLGTAVCIRMRLLHSLLSIRRNSACMLCKRCLTRQCRTRFLRRILLVVCFKCFAVCCCNAEFIP
uniref:YGGT family protein n=1 Tax=Arundo donax TaxID=35708 RepID=A0A0A9E5G7_ARUDO